MEKKNKQTKQNKNQKKKKKKNALFSICVIKACKRIPFCIVWLI